MRLQGSDHGVGEPTWSHRCERQDSQDPADRSETRTQVQVPHYFPRDREIRSVSSHFRRDSHRRTLSCANVGSPQGRVLILRRQRHPREGRNTRLPAEHGCLERHGRGVSERGYDGSLEPGNAGLRRVPGCLRQAFRPADSVRLRPGQSRDARASWRGASWTTSRRPTAATTTPFATARSASSSWIPARTSPTRTRNTPGWLTSTAYRAEQTKWLRADRPGGVVPELPLPNRPGPHASIPQRAGIRRHADPRALVSDPEPGTHRSGCAATPIGSPGSIRMNRPITIRSSSMHRTWSSNVDVSEDRLNVTIRQINGEIVDTVALKPRSTD